MSKTVVGLIAGGATTVAVAGVGFLAYNQLSQPNNSNTNSNVVATSSNTTSTKSIKSELLGTWVQTFKTDDPDNPKNKIEFTEYEVITYTEVVTYTDEEVPQKKKNTETEKGKYKVLCGQFLELKDGKSEAVSISKFTIEGDELTIAGRTKDLDKNYKRESRNTAANTSTDTADSNTEEVALNQKDLVGTWIDTEKPEFKYVFTEDKMTASRNDQQMDEGKYKLPCGQILESTDERGFILFSKVTIQGSEMTIYRNGAKYKLRRESANGDQAVETPEEALRKKLVGGWVVRYLDNIIDRANQDTTPTTAKEKRIISENLKILQKIRVRLEFNEDGKYKLMKLSDESVSDEGAYLVLSQNTVELTSSISGTKSKIIYGHDLQDLEWDRYQKGSWDHLLDVIFVRVNP